MLLKDLKFACLDTETTGLSPEGGGRICEVAISVSKNGQCVDEFSTLINPDMPMHPDVIPLTAPMMNRAGMIWTAWSISQLSVR